MTLKQFKKKLANKLFFLEATEIEEIIKKYENLILEEIHKGSIEEIVLQQYSVEEIVNKTYFDLPTKRKEELTVNRKRSSMQIFGEIIGFFWALLFASPFLILFAASFLFISFFVYIAGGMWFIVRYIICFTIKIFNPKSALAEKIRQTNFFLFPWIGKVIFKKGNK
ncbi:hypothetical protein [Spiroplasma endosymbiont of Labia minor]|uniref:hypothetical protein n=1 Tax=Spiroplasma endosymbiont of Labia minor TaxID=3066305 RepID=UPI0030CC88EC